MLCPRGAAALAVLALLYGLGPALAQAPSAPAAPGENKTEMPNAAPGAPAAPAAPPSITGQRGPQFGEEITLTAKTIVFKKGAATWDTAFETLVAAFKSVADYLKREGLSPAGPQMVIYTSTEDTGFQFQAAVPVAEGPKNPPTGDFGVGKSPGGKALKFVHNGSYDSMDTTYELITNHLDDKKLEAKELFIEEYVTDPVTTSEDKLVINVLVPLK
jgi:effector-binding domain-containing protein